MIKIDGKEYVSMVTGFKRNFEVADSESTGRTADWRMHRDVVGTFYNYSVEVDTHFMNVTDYDSLFELISSPTQSHHFEFPYGQGIISFEGYVTKGGDTLSTMKDGKSLWGKLAFNVISLEPQRRA